MLLSRQFGSGKVGVAPVLKDFRSLKVAEILREFSVDPKYFCGDRLLRFLELPRSLQEEVRSLTENENSPRNRASAMRTFDRHCLQ